MQFEVMPFGGDWCSSVKMPLIEGLYAVSENFFLDKIRPMQQDQFFLLFTKPLLLRVPKIGHYAKTSV